ncbi:MAG: radical SAM protein [Bacteroidetes bacterium]|nr:radical SAM protein [Bacteroidota bacterium]
MDQGQKKEEKKEKCQPGRLISLLADTWRLMSVLTFRRITNLLVLSASYHFSRITGKARHAGMPYAVSIEPTTSCNLHCPECPSGMRAFTRATGMLDLPHFERFLEEVQPHVFYLTLYFQGEPYLNTGFFDFVKLARKRKIYVATSTNGHFLNPETARQTVLSGLNRLIISMDGTSQDAYGSYRVGGSLEKVKEGIRNLAEAKRMAGINTPFLIIQFLVLKTNEHQIADMYRLGKELGVDKVEIKTAQFYDFEAGKELMPDNDRYARYNEITDPETGVPQYMIKHSLANHCFRMWSSCVITWDGMVVPCCYDKDATHVMGNLNSQRFKEIWRSSSYRDFRQRILTERKAVEICRNCVE